LRGRKRLEILILAGVVVLGFGLYGLKIYLDRPGPAEIITVSTNSPSEEEVSSSSVAKVLPNHPKRIVLPTIEAEGLIQRVGLDQNGQVTSPDNIHLAGWFTNKPIPGDKGVALIAGHIQGISLPGVFSNLENLKPGDKFQVELGDKSKREFEVVSVKSYDTEKYAENLFKQVKSIERQLNLVAYDIKANANDERVFVVSKLVE
jgi:LPXTG-site transpeptidase (sortase) family protein